MPTNLKRSASFPVYTIPHVAVASHRNFTRHKDTVRSSFPVRPKYYTISRLGRWMSRNEPWISNKTLILRIKGRKYIGGTKIRLVNGPEWKASIYMSERKDRLSAILLNSNWRVLSRVPTIRTTKVERDEEHHLQHARCRALESR